MLIAYGQPADIIATVDRGTAANLPALIDGQPASIARLSDGAGSISLRADWGAATAIRVVAVLGLSCPAGTALTLTGKRDGDSGYPYALGGNAATQTVVQLPDGSRAAWFVLPVDNTPLVGLQLTVGASAFDVGELVAMQAVDVPIDKGWSVDLIDPSIADRTLGGQLNVVARRRYRRMAVKFSLAALPSVRGGGLQGGMDWQLLVHAVGPGDRCAAIPRWRSSSGAINADELHRTALYGYAQWATVSHVAGPFSVQGAVLEEIPPL